MKKKLQFEGAHRANIIIDGELITQIKYFKKIETYYEVLLVDAFGRIIAYFRKINGVTGEQEFCTEYLLQMFERTEYGELIHELSKQTPVKEDIKSKWAKQ